MRFMRAKDVPVFHYPLDDTYTVSDVRAFDIMITCLVISTFWLFALEHWICGLTSAFVTVTMVLYTEFNPKRW